MDNWTRADSGDENGDRKLEGGESLLEDHLVDPLDQVGVGTTAIRGAVVRAIANGAGMVIYLGTAPFVIRHLGVVDFGRYAAVLSLIAVVTLISDAGLTVVGLRMYVQDDHLGRRRLLRNLLGLRLVISACGVVAAWSFAVLAGYESGMRLGTLLAGTGAMIIIAQQTYVIPLSASLRLGTVAALELLRQTLMAGGALTLVILQANVISFLSLGIPSGLLAAAATVVVARSGLPLVPAYELTVWRDLLRESLSGAVAGAIGGFFYRSALIVMSVVALETQTGYFGAAFRIFEGMLSVPSLLCASVFPVLARFAVEAEDRLASALQRLFDLGLALGLGGTITLAIAAKPVIDVIAGPGFEPAVPVLRLQACALVFTFLVSVWATGLWAVRAQRELAWANAGGLAAAVALTALLAKGHGAVGAAAGMLFAEGLLAAAYAFGLMHARPLLRVRLTRVPRVAAAGALSIPAVFLPLPDLLQALVAGATYTVALLVLGGLDRDSLADVLRVRP